MQLLENRAPELSERCGITFQITGIASRRLGWTANSKGICGAGALAREISPQRGSLASGNTLASNIEDWLATARADILFEATSLNVNDGQPAVDHIRAALTHGAHAITANKGPIVHAYR
ncbi:MAG TPA: hypothetical protein VFW44_13835, partial [Bryobacteraceae bacterium]|nr:hypothetical protein [Bryobacteraceae bacterium]